ncbi:unnamed protein product [Urochloa humidicola]
MGDRKQAKKRLPPLPVSVSMAAEAKKKLPPFPVVQIVCVWALLSACGIAYAVINDAMHVGDTVPPPTSRWATRIPLTEAQAMAASAIEAAQLWLAAPQAAAAALGLLLSAPRIRRALAFVALSANGWNHYLCARVIGILFMAAPWNYNIVISTVILAVFGGVLDVLAFLALLSSSGEDEEY